MGREGRYLGVALHSLSIVFSCTALNEGHFNAIACKSLSDKGVNTSITWVTYHLMKSMVTTQPGPGLPPPQPMWSPASPAHHVVSLLPSPPCGLPSPPCGLLLPSPPCGLLLPSPPCSLPPPQPTMWSPALRRASSVVVQAAMPDEKSRVPAAPSNILMTSAAASTVGLPQRL